jgi:hypothetical protein
MSEWDDLAQAFGTLGVDDPEGWATSQLDEGIPQLARATILVEFAEIVGASADQVLTGGEFPSDRLERTLFKIREAGVSDDDLGMLLKFGSSLTVFSILSLLDGATEVSNNPGAIEIALAHGVAGEENLENTLEVEELGLHESWGEVVTAKLGKEVYWW